MRKLKRYNGLILIVSLLLTWSCASTGTTTKTSKVSRTNLAYLYQPDKQFASLKCAVFHTSDTTSELFVKVNFSDLLYQKDPYTGLYSCSYRLSYTMWKGYESAEVISGNSEISGDSINYGKSVDVIHTFQLPARIPDNYVIQVELFDMNRKASSRQYVNVWKSSMYDRQSFLLFDQNASLMFRNYVYPGEVLKIMTGKPGLNELTVSCYFRDFPVARPPYTEDKDPVFDHRPDSLYTIPLSEGKSEWMEFKRKGFYHFRVDTTQRAGLTIFVYDEGFPEMYSAEQLREPLRYISTRKEYDSLMASDQPKAAVDDFWLKTAGTPERAKALIQKYYRNVEESNQYFTSYLEGWKTDRGLIYTVLGKPNYVYRSDNSEEWIYGEPQNRSSLNFTFVKVKNPFTGNDFMLLRSPTYKEPWFITVQSWRR